MDDKLTQMIAAGAPRVDFSPLSSLLGDYEKGKQYARQDAAADLFKDGAPMLDGKPDYMKMAQGYFQVGDHGTAIQLARLASQNGQWPGFDDAPPSGNVRNSNPADIYFNAPAAQLSPLQTQIGGGNFGNSVGQSFGSAPTGGQGMQPKQMSGPLWTDPGTNFSYHVRNGSLYRVR